MSVIVQRSNQIHVSVQVHLSQTLADGSPLPLGTASLVNGYLTGLSDSQLNWSMIQTLSKEASTRNLIGNGRALHINRSVYDAFQGDHAALLGFTASSVLGR